MKRYSFLFCLFLIFVLYKIGFADTLYLKNGTQIVGKTISQDPEKVIFRIGEGQDTVDLTFFSEEVLRIDKTDVSNVIELPFVKGKGIKFPRPVLKDVPFSTNLTVQDEGSQLNETKSEQDIIKDLSPKAQQTIEELQPLLNKEESDYFAYMNQEVEKIMNKMTSFTKDALGKTVLLFTNPQSSTESEIQLNESMKDISTETESIITKFTDLKPPGIFTNFHKKYLGYLGSTHETIKDVLEGRTQDAQAKQIDVQNIEVELQQELEKILEEKKKEGKEL